MFVYDALDLLSKKIINSTRILDEGLAFSSYDCSYEFEYDSLESKNKINYQKS